MQVDVKKEINIICVYACLAWAGCISGIMIFMSVGIPSFSKILWKNAIKLHKINSVCVIMVAIYHGRSASLSHTPQRFGIWQNHFAHYQTLFTNSRIGNCNAKTKLIHSQVLRYTFLYTLYWSKNVRMLR